MDFKMENFQIGINENGYHFRDSKSGVIFTLLKTLHGEMDIAICSESANEQVCEQLKQYLKERLRREGISLNPISDIALEKCYISENQNSFAFWNFAMDSIGILHQKSKKIIGLIQIDGKRPIIGMFLSDFYGAEEMIRDFFSLCSENIDEIVFKLCQYKICIKRKYAISTIKQSLLKGAVEGIRQDSLKYFGKVSYTIKEYGDINASINKYDKVEIRRCAQENYYIVNAVEKNFPIIWLINLIEMVKNLPQIHKLQYFYKHNGKVSQISITKKNADRVLKEAIRQKRISLII